MSLYHIVLVLAVILLLIAIAIPSNRSLTTWGAVGILITDLEDYKKQHGTYPEEVDGFTENWDYHAEAGHCSDGKLPMGYLTYNEKTEFILSCFDRGSGEVWEVYSSETGKWTPINDYDEGSVRRELEGKRGR